MIVVIFQDLAMSKVLVMKTKTILLVAIIAVFGCTKKMGPDESLRDFVHNSIRGNLTRDRLLGATTGKLRDELDQLGEEEIAKYLKFTGASRESFRINLKNCESNICYLTYTLKYDLAKDGVKTFEVELKKMAELRLVDEKWLLADVTDIKTFYGSEQPIEP